MKKLTRNEMKLIVGGCEQTEEEINGGVICIACSSDDACATGKVCRSSPSCPEPKVCAKPIYC